MAVQTTLLTSNRSVTRLMLDQPTTYKAYIDASSTNLTSGDYYRLFKYDANTLILGASIITETVEGAGDTVDITDDESGTTTLCSNHDVNTDNAVTSYTAAAKFKDAAGYICIKPDANITVAKFWVVATLLKVSTTD